MILKSIKYKEQDGWSIEGRGGVPLNLGQINLITGQNATGKTNTVERIRNAARLIAGIINPLPFPDSYVLFDLVFENDETINYYLKFSSEEIQEILKINDNLKLDRQKGQLFYEEEGRFLSFQGRKGELAITKGDSLQQPFFDKVHNWAVNVLHYKFGGHMGRNLNVPNITSKESLFVNLPFVCERGNEEFGNKYDNSIIEDLNSIGYEISEIIYVTDGDVIIVGVQEKSLEKMTRHYQMSQGMFRVFSLFVQLNYSLLSKQPSLILIDDIGEGLDYERSKKLIDLIIKKVEGTQVQLIMTTNDRFVMNKVPLKYWQVIKREKNKSVFYNYENSKQTFDDFALTGLSNFDFFATEFFIKGFDEYVKVKP